MEIQRNHNKSNAKYKWLEKKNVMPSLKKTNEEIDKQSCICHRNRGLITCNSCQKSFMGRIAQRCPEHPEIAYLMDARNCAFCGATTNYLQIDLI